MVSLRNVNRRSPRFFVSPAETTIKLSSDGRKCGLVLLGENGNYRFYLRSEVAHAPADQQVSSKVSPPPTIRPRRGHALRQSPLPGQIRQRREPRSVRSAHCRMAFVRPSCSTNVARVGSTNLRTLQRLTDCSERSVETNGYHFGITSREIMPNR